MAEKSTVEEEVEVELVSGVDEHVIVQEDSWHKKVWDRTGGNCYNCGSSHKVRTKLIVPEIAGGRKVAENGHLICRACEMATDRSLAKERHADNRPINFWVSRRLFNTLSEAGTGSFKSKSALIRYLMGKFIEAEDHFDDLENYQDSPGADAVKVNAWVPKDTYAVFQEKVTARGATVTDTIKGLLMVFEMETNKEK